jgi:predicted permease
MLLTGLTLSTLRLRQLFTDKTAYLVCALRLIGIPALILGLCLGLRAIGLLPAGVWPAALIMAAMPCGLNTVVFPKLIGKDCTIGARLAFLSHLLSLLTLPLFLSLIAR